MAAGAGIAIILNTPLINTNKISVIKIKARNRSMREVFDGGNYREIANRFGISEVAVRQIVGR